MAKWRPVEIAVFMMVVTVCFVVCSAALTPLFRGTMLSDTKTKLLTGIVGSLTSMISLYLGSELQRRRQDKKDG